MLKIRHYCGVFLGGALLTAGTAAALKLLRPEGDLPVEMIVGLGLVGGIGPALTAAWLGRRFNKRLLKARQQLDKLQEAPKRVPPLSAELDPLGETLSRFCDRYVRMANECEMARESLTSLRDKVNKQWNPPQEAKSADVVDPTLKQKNIELNQARQRLQQVEQALDRLQESYFDLYHNSPVMYFSLDLRGRIVTCNDTLLRNLGYARQELVEHPFGALLTAGGPERWQQHAEQFKAASDKTGRDEGELEIQWRKKDGSLVDVLIRTVVLRDDQGQPLRFRSAALEVSERNRLAHELRSRGDELEQANTRMKSIISELEEFTHVVSHDLKEPLRTIQAFSRILAEDYASQVGPDGFEYINHMVQASRRLGSLIDDLLTLSQAGLITRSPEVFNLNEAVAIVRRDLAHLLQRKGARLITEGTLAEVIGDQRRIIQLLANLVANGLKYNTSPQPKVTIGMTAMTPNPDAPAIRQVTVFVRDNGIGIDPRYHQQIFGIFRRLHAEETFEGTGAGLAICKKIIEAHGGRIWIESQPGQGATFFFTLPRPRGRTAMLISDSKPTTQEPGPLTPRNGHVAAAKSTQSTQRILLVEDMYEVGMIIQKLAMRSGLEVSWFTNAEEAWVFLEKNQPDLLLLDYHLPGMNGLELCQRIRTQPRLAQVPIALFSQGHSPEEMEKFRSQGADHILSKDLLCQPAHWQQCIHEILSGQGQKPTAIKGT